MALKTNGIKKWMTDVIAINFNPVSKIAPFK
jgi:hypothetical protein